MNRLPVCQTLPRCAQGGFALIEALVALLIVSFGMLAIAGMQTTLARSSDLAKQRSEAVRLAQQQVERLRSFDSVVIGQGNFNYATDVVSSASNETITPANTSTTFVRSWTVTLADGTTPAGANDAQKWIHVKVEWADRGSTALNQSVRLDSVVARNNPASLKGLTGGQSPPKVRQPKYRSLNIPYPAVTTSNPNRSAFIPPPGNVAYVFDNDSGNIVQSCTGITALIEGIDVLTAASAGGGSCVALNAYLLSGNVRVYDKPSQPTASDIQNTNDPTLGLDPSTPLTVDASATGYGPSAFTCYAQRQKVMQAANVQPATISSMVRSGGVVTVTTTGSHGYPVGVLVATEGLSSFSFEGSFEITAVPSATTLIYVQPGPDASISGTASSKIKLIQQITLAESATVPAGYNGQPVSTFIAYACIVTPVDDDNNPNTVAAWWGQVNLLPASTWAIGSNYSATPKEYQVCRYSGDYGGASGDNSLGNAEHPRYYRRVIGALVSQNYLIVRGGQSCPADVPVNLSGNSVSDLFNTHTVRHQPTASLSYQCLTAGCSGSNRQDIEPSSPTTPAPMF